MNIFRYHSDGRLAEEWVQTDYRGSFRSWAPRLPPWAALLKAAQGLRERLADHYRQSTPALAHAQHKPRHLLPLAPPYIWLSVVLTLGSTSAWATADAAAE